MKPRGTASNGVDTRSRNPENPRNCLRILENSRNSENPRNSFRHFGKFERLDAQETFIRNLGKFEKLGKPKKHPPPFRKTREIRKSQETLTPSAILWNSGNLRNSRNRHPQFRKIRETRNTAEICSAISENSRNRAERLRAA